LARHFPTGIRGSSNWPSLETFRSVASIVETSIQRGGLDTEDVAALIATGREQLCREEIRAGAKEVRRHVGGREIEFIIPVYLTSFCQNAVNSCRYLENERDPRMEQDLLAEYSGARPVGVP